MFKSHIFWYFVPVQISLMAYSQLARKNNQTTAKTEWKAPKRIFAFSFAFVRCEQALKKIWQNFEIALNILLCEDSDRSLFGVSIRFPLRLGLMWISLYDTRATYIVVLFTFMMKDVCRGSVTFDFGLNPHGSYFSFKLTFLVTRRVTLLMETGLLHDFFGNFSTRGDKYYFHVEGNKMRLNPDEVRLKWTSKQKSIWGQGGWVGGRGSKGPDWEGGDWKWETRLGAERVTTRWGQEKWEPDWGQR